MIQFKKISLFLVLMLAGQAQFICGAENKQPDISTPPTYPNIHYVTQNIVHSMAIKTNLSVSVRESSEKTFEYCGAGIDPITGEDVLILPQSHNFSEHQLTSLIGHELMHLKNKDYLTILFMQTVKPVIENLSSYITPFILAASLISKNRFKITPNKVKTLLTLSALPTLNSHVFTPWMHRRFEKRADIQSAETFPENRVAEGLIDTFQRAQQKNIAERTVFINQLEELPTEDPLAKKATINFNTWLYNKTFLDEYGNTVHDKLHPYFSTRIAYLTPIAEQQAKDRLAQEQTSA